MAAFGSAREDVRAKPLGRRLALPSVGVLGAATLVTAAALLPVVQNSNATTAGYETRQLERHKADLQASIFNAQKDIAELGALQRIDREARDRLGMAPADRTVSVQVTRPAPTDWRVPARFIAAQQPPPAPEAASGHGLLGLLFRLTSR